MQQQKVTRAQWWARRPLLFSLAAESALFFYPCPFSSRFSVAAQVLGFFVFPFFFLF
jgi:hypothetical protein